MLPSQLAEQQSLNEPSLEKARVRYSAKFDTSTASRPFVASSSQSGLRNLELAANTHASNSSIGWTYLVALRPGTSFPRKAVAHGIGEEQAGRRMIRLR
jgi:hypothetical protein